jgi:molecular chaperone GrpE
MIPSDTKSDNRTPEPAVDPEPNAAETGEFTKTHVDDSREDSTAQDDIDQLRKERDSLYERLSRLQAEFENARKREAREQQGFQEFALADAIKSLLPVLDSFDWALQSATQDPQELRTGFDMIRKQLHDTLGKLGLNPIPATGEPFDPHVHEAIETVDSPDAEENRVLSELRRGYKLGTRLLRPSMVSVTKKSGR